MDVADHRRLRQREQVAVVQQILAGIPEALAADVRLGHPVGADGRAHGAVDDGNPPGQDILRGDGPAVVRWTRSPSSESHRASSCAALSSAAPRRRGRQRFVAHGNEHGEGVAGLARPDCQSNVFEAAIDEQLSQLLVAEAEGAVAELLLHPALRRAGGARGPAPVRPAPRSGPPRRRRRPGRSRGGAPATGARHRRCRPRAAALRARRASRRCSRPVAAGPGRGRGSAPTPSGRPR